MLGLWRLWVWLLWRWRLGGWMGLRDWNKIPLLLQFGFYLQSWLFLDCFFELEVLFLLLELFFLLLELHCHFFHIFNHFFILFLFCFSIYLWFFLWRNNITLLFVLTSIYRNIFRFIINCHLIWFDFLFLTVSLFFLYNLRLRLSKFLPVLLLNLFIDFSFS